MQGAAAHHDLFSLSSDQGYFRIVRRGGHWYVERDGLISASFDTPRAAARALSRGEVILGDAPVPGTGVPADIERWRRGDLPPLWPSRLWSSSEPGRTA